MRPRFVADAGGDRAVAGPRSPPGACSPSWSPISGPAMTRRHGKSFFREEVSDEIVVNTLSTYLECTPLEKQFLLEADSLHQQARRLSDLIEFMMHDRSRREGLGLMDRAIAIQVSRLMKDLRWPYARRRSVVSGLCRRDFRSAGAERRREKHHAPDAHHAADPDVRHGHGAWATIRCARRICVRRLIGYVPQERAIDRFLTGREHLELLGALYHLTKDEAAKRIAELLKLVELEEHADRAAKTYSGRMKRKLDIACGLLPDPKILFLDEPTLGLDVQSRLRIWDYVRMLKARGMTIVMTTNYLDEADQLCDRLAIIDGGKIKTLGSPAELKVGLGGDIVSLTLKETEQVPTLVSALKRQPAMRAVKATPTGLDIRVESPRRPCPPSSSPPIDWIANWSLLSITGRGWTMCSSPTRAAPSKTNANRR